MVYYSSTYYVPKFDTTARSYLYYLKVIYERTSFLIVLTLSIFLLLNYNENTAINERISDIINTFSKPCIHTINFIDTGIEKTFCFLGNIIFMYKENIYLKEQNKKLKKNEITIHNVNYENKRLRELVNFIGINNIDKYITIKYNFITKNKFENKIKLNVGKDNGVNDNSVVINSDGNYIGKTIRTTDKSTEIMLLTDIDSKIEATTLDNKVKLILNGNNSLYLNIAYINDNEYKLLEGDSVFLINNSFQDLDFYIGKIVKVQNDFKVKIESSFNYIDYITIIDSDKINYNN